MKKTITFALAMALGGMIGSSHAQQAASEATDTAGKIQQLAELGPGVHKIQKDEAGRMKSCVIVGQARISTVLGNTKGLELARKRANLNANAEFVKWMDGSVKAVESMANESIVYLEGSAQAISESGKATEVTKDNVELVAQGIVRGMSLIGFHQDGAGGGLTVVYGWTPNYASLAGEAQNANANPGTIEAAVPQPAPQSLPEQPIEPIETKTVVSESADGFLN
jgi:hypothetical protein